MTRHSHRPTTPRALWPIHLARAGILAALVLLSGFGVAAAQQSTPNPSVFDTEETEAIEEIVRSYLEEHPEIVIEAINAYREKLRLAEEQERQRVFAANQNELWNDPLSPVLGNPEGDVVIVEFFDYRCPYCKVTAPRLQAMMAEDPNVKVVMKEYPILSEESFDGARAALAAAKQGKYEAFHFELMDNPGNLSERHLRTIARRVGMDADQMVEDMHSDEVEAAIRRNHQLGRRLQLTGTPALFVGPFFRPGAIELEEIRELVGQTRRQPS